MAAMRLEKLRQVDLNLLITFAAIAEERSVTAAASRLLLSQPAVSRALQRARAMFQMTFCSGRRNGFDSRCAAARFSKSLRGLLPRMENLVTPNLFDPTREKSHFAFQALTNVCTVVSPLVPAVCKTDATKCSLNSFPAERRRGISGARTSLILFCT